MSKNVTEYGKEIADILSGTADSLQGLKSLMALYAEFMDKEVTALTPATVEAFKERHKMAEALIGSMRDKAEQIQADLERLEMTCDEMEDAEV